MSQNNLRSPINHQFKSYDCLKNKSLKFENEQDDFEMKSVWNELRMDEKLFDGIIRLPNGDGIKVHRVILSSSSRYFKACFTYNCNKEKSETEIYVDVTKPIMDLILDYAYTGTCLINWNNIEELLPVADRLEVIGLIRQCCSFLISEIKPNNAIGIYLFAKQYFCTELKELSKNYILENFKKIYFESTELVEMNEDDLCEILSNEYLNINREETIFEVIKLWVEYDLVKRSHHLPNLLSCIRFGLLDFNFFQDKLCKWPPLEYNPVCMKIIDKAMSYFTNPNYEKGGYNDRCYDFSKPRIPYEIIFVVGGWTYGSPTDIIEVFDLRAHCWLRMNIFDTRRAYHGVCEIDNKIYVLGGFDGTTHFNSVRCYNPITYTWEERACMYQPRCYVSVAVHNKRIYAMGGYNGHSRLDSVERYDPERNQWEILAPMNKFRSDAGAAATKDYIFIAGGFNGSEVMRSCEMYNPVTNQWTLISVMLDARSGVGLVACQDTIYAIGGFDGTNRLNSVEKFSFFNPHWQYVADLMVPRSNFASAVVEDKIYAIGGYNGNHTISYVEVYDPVLNIWNSDTHMNINRSAHAACVLRGLKNARVYSRYANEVKYTPCTYIEQTPAPAEDDSSSSDFNENVEENAGDDHN